MSTLSSHPTRSSPPLSLRFQSGCRGDPLPAAPSDLRTSVYPHLPTKVRLDWKDNTTNESGFEIERMITVGDTTTDAAASHAKASEGDGVFQPYASVGKGITSFIDKKAYPGSKVEYRVRAKVGATNSSASPVATAITPPPKACRRPSFDLWSGGVRFADPKGENRYLLVLKARGNRLSGWVYRETIDDWEEDEPQLGLCGWFNGLTPPSSNLLVGTIVFTNDAPIAADDLHPAYQLNTPYTMRLQLATEGRFAYQEIADGSIEPAGASLFAEPLSGSPARAKASKFLYYPQPWALAEICLKGSALPRQPAPNDTVAFSIALQNGGSCGIGNGRLALRLAARGGTIATVTPGRGAIMSVTDSAALISLPTLGPTGTNATLRDAILIAVFATAPSGGTVELDAEVYDIASLNERRALLPVGIVVPALRTFAVTVK